MRELLGGKGANVAEMTRVLGAERVPAGFTITTEACVAYMEAGRACPEGSTSRSRRRSTRLEEQAGKTLGDAEDPLLVSVRSGARESMPGMLDTVLNLGLNDESVRGPRRATDNERFAWDSYRRFVQMFGNVCRGIPGERYEDAIKRAEVRRRRQATTSSSTSTTCRTLTERFKELFHDETGEDFPQDPQEQLRQAIRAVFDSWIGRSRGRVPAHQPHPGRVGHGGERAADGVRQQGRQLVLRRGLLARRDHRRAEAVGRLPAERPGRGRRVGRAHAARHARA